ncbi:MAG TPA: hypothetical protein VD978_19640 [Azospirillum sp.]|nr:hypothetical protein [Azospirillum sp.]
MADARHEQIKAAVLRQLETEGEAPRLLTMLGSLLAAEGNLQGAFELLARATQLDPTDALTRANYRFVMKRLGLVAVPELSDEDARALGLRDERELPRFGYRVFSQFDEDGIIARIFDRIGTTNRYFVEFGSGNGTENNTINLLLDGWSGLWIDADEDAVASTATLMAGPLRRGAVRSASVTLTPENIESVFEAHGVPRDFDFMSVDVDGPDYWLWKAVRRWRPRVVCAEFSRKWGADGLNPAGADAASDALPAAPTSPSLAALEQLGREKGYSLVGRAAGTQRLLRAQRTVRRPLRRALHRRAALAAEVRAGPLSSCSPSRTGLRWAASCS